MSASEYDLQRDLLTIEELLVKTRSSFSDYAGSDADRHAKEFGQAIRKVRTLQAKMRRWFAPDAK